MRIDRRGSLIAGLAVAAVFAAVALPAPARAQGAKKPAEKAKKTKTPFDTIKYNPTRLFASNEPLTFTLTLDLGRIKKDRTGETPYRPAVLSFKDADSASYTVPIRVQTRGIWRRKNCDIPPLRLDLPKDSIKHTVLAGQNRIKIVIPCRNKDDYEQMILQEANLYRVYNLLTPLSHRMRVVRLTVVDSSAPAKPVMTRWAFITESSGEMAARNASIEYDVKGATNGDLDSKTATIVGLFQYMIGNTDFSIPALHNVELLARQMDVFPVVYDFDWTGVVNPPYGFPDSRLGIKRLTDHLFRGPCGSGAEFPAVVELFKSKRDEINALFKDRIGQLMDPDRSKETLAFFDDFYKTIGNERTARREILDQCRTP